MLDVESKKSQRLKKPSQYKTTFHSKTLLEENAARLNVIFDKTSMQFSIAQKVRLANAVRAATNVLKIAYNSAQNDFEDDLQRVLLWFGSPQRDVCALVRHAVEKLYKVMTNNEQFISFYGKPIIEFNFAGAPIPSGEDNEEDRSVPENIFNDSENRLIKKYGSRYKEQILQADERGYKHTSESYGEEYTYDDFVSAPTTSVNPRFAFDVGVAEKRFCAPPATHLFEHAAGGSAIYIEPDALACGVELPDLMQIIFHQLAYIHLGVNDPNARVGIGTKPLLKANCMRNAIFNPEATLTDGGNLGCFITSFEQPITREEILRVAAMWPKSEYNPDDCNKWNQNNGDPGEAMVTEDNYFVEPPLVKSNNAPVPQVVAPTNKTFLGHMRSKIFGKKKN